jgi:hypothetical protein
MARAAEMAAPDANESSVEIAQLHKYAAQSYF